jgi:predicted XRE-type DNA-binding protein
MKGDKNLAVVESSGNVFADAGFPPDEAAELLAKAALVREISMAIKSRGLTRAKCSRLLGLSQPELSALLRGHLLGFSTEQLFRFLTLLGCDVEVVIRRHRSSVPGRVTVTTGRAA